MKTIVFLMDSLSRRYLPAYGNAWVHTPNIDRLAELPGEALGRHRAL